MEGYWQMLRGGAATTAAGMQVLSQHITSHHSIKSHTCHTHWKAAHTPRNASCSTAIIAHAQKNCMDTCIHTSWCLAHSLVSQFMRNTPTDSQPNRRKKAIISTDAFFDARKSCWINTTLQHPYPL